MHKIFIKNLNKKQTAKKLYFIDFFKHFIDFFTEKQQNNKLFTKPLKIVICKKIFFYYICYYVVQKSHFNQIRIKHFFGFQKKQNLTKRIQTTPNL